MGAGKYVAPNYTTQSGTVYPLGLDQVAEIMRRIGATFNPSAQDTPNMTVLIDAGSVLDAGVLSEYAAQSTSTIVAPVTDPRIDRVVLDPATGVVSVVAGLEATSPVAPAIPAGQLPICQVALAITTTQITDSLITDERNLFVGGDVADDLYLSEFFSAL